MNEHSLLLLEKFRSSSKAIWILGHFLSLIVSFSLMFQFFFTKLFIFELLEVCLSLENPMFFTGNALQKLQFLVPVTFLLFFLFIGCTKLLRIFIPENQSLTFYYRIFPHYWCISAIRLTVIPFFLLKQTSNIVFEV